MCNLLLFMFKTLSLILELLIVLVHSLSFWPLFKLNCIIFFYETPITLFFLPLNTRLKWEEKSVFGIFIKNIYIIQFIRGSMGRDNKQLTNIAKNRGTKLRMLNIKDNKLYYPYSTGVLTAINPNKIIHELVCPFTRIYHR